MDTRLVKTGPTEEAERHPIIHPTVRVVPKLTEAAETVASERHDGAAADWSRFRMDGE